jgi:hypothetical protein
MPELPDVELQLALNTGDPDPWVTVATGANLFLSGSTSQGSSRFDGVTVRYEPGRLTAVVDNRGGEFDATNPSSPYRAAGRTLLNPRRGVRLRATWASPDEEPLFTGFLDAIPHTYEDRDVSMATITATDGSKVLENFNGIEQSPAGEGEDTGARINRIADNAQWPEELRDIDTGNTTVQATTLAGVARTEMLLTADSEIGELYFDGWGKLRFRRRHAMYTEERSAVSQATFGDRPPELPFADPGPTIAYDDQQLRNRVQVARKGGTVQVVEDIESQIRYSWNGGTPMPSTWSRNDFIMETDDEALAYAQYVLYQNKDADLRFEDMEINPLAAPDALFPQVLGRRLGDRITVNKRRTDGSVITRDVFIRGISHVLAPQSWRTKWVFQSAAKFSFLVLDGSVVGRLDENALGY